MTIKTLISTGLFAAVATISFGAIAADADKAVEVKAPNADVQTDKAPAKKIKRHSHVEEKTGMPMPQSASEGKAEKPAEKAEKPAEKADKPQARHLHPRDGK